LPAFIAPLAMIRSSSCGMQSETRETLCCKGAARLSRLRVDGFQPVSNLLVNHGGPCHSHLRTAASTRAFAG
jgi:hypothetical protein